MNEATTHTLNRFDRSSRCNESAFTQLASIVCIKDNLSLIRKRAFQCDFEAKNCATPWKRTFSTDTFHLVLLFAFTMYASFVRASATHSLDRKLCLNECIPTKYYDNFIFQNRWISKIVRSNIKFGKLLNVN